eukprot:6125399-Alexandrium_andersonii.AAC.1
MAARGVAYRRGPPPRPRRAAPRTPSRGPGDVGKLRMKKLIPDTGATKRESPHDTMRVKRGDYRRRVWTESICTQSASRERCATN